ncbi:MAG: ribonuclease HII [Cyanobacteria bacterium P01_A01_bin.70]
MTSVDNSDVIATAGVDEVGRGALFGPVVAGAVILTAKTTAVLAELGVTDSKRLAPARRKALVKPIQQQAQAYAIGWASAREIDRLNILQASLLAMKRAVNRLSIVLTPFYSAKNTANFRQPGLNSILNSAIN